MLRVVTGGQLTLRDSQFSRNIPRTVIALTASTHVALSDCQFSLNESDLQGEATIYANRTKLLWLTRCTFEGNKAKHGGALFASQRSVVRIQRSTFRNNVACKNGGALNADKNSAIHLEHSRFVRNQALDDNGGGIRCRGANVTLEHRVTLRHNEAGYNGGAISAEDSCQMDIANASIIDNMSRQTGGGVSVRSGSTAILRDTVFRDNDAKYRGGAIFVERATLTVISSRFSKNVAVGGGSLALRLSAVNVTSSVFEKDEAKVVGGSINALWRCQLSLTDVSIMASRSKIGAGLYLAHSFLTATNLHVSTCNATESGGGLHAGFASAFSCRGCAFEGNIAGLLGGGVSLNATHPLKLSYNFTNSRFTENRAGRRGGASAVVISAGLASVFGRCLVGALYFLSLHGEDDGCPTFGTNCTRLFLVGSHFSQNAAAVGGAFFVSHPKTVKYCCAAALPQEPSAVEAHASGLQTLDDLQTSCPEWYDNSAEVFGSFAASYARDVRPSVQHSRSNTFEPWNGTFLYVDDHRSGAALPSVRLTVVDGFGQGPVMGVNDTVVTAVMSADDDFFVGSIRVELSEGEATIGGVTGFHRHGQHNIHIDFSEETIPVLTMVVTVRNCSFGESSEAEGTFCSICSESQFSFDPRGKCRRCPEHGDCTSKTAIHPRPGYWHNCPCSQTLEECPIKEACDFEERKAQLAALTHGLDTCTPDVTFLAQYRAAQCRDASDVT